MRHQDTSETDCPFCGKGVAERIIKWMRGQPLAFDKRGIKPAFNCCGRVAGQRNEEVGCISLGFIPYAAAVRIYNSFDQGQSDTQSMLFSVRAGPRFP